MAQFTQQNLVILAVLLVKNKIFTQNHKAVVTEIICHLHIARI